jgi:hypothetical protein
MAIGMFFFTKIILCCHTTSLSMKHANALESNNVLISIAIDLPYLIVIGNKKIDVRFEGKLGPF